MIATAVETLGFAALTAAAWVGVGLWAALTVAGVALLLIANFDIGRPQRVRRIVLSSPLTNDSVDETLVPVVTNGAVDREQA